MGGCRAPQAPFRLAVDHSLPPMANPETVEVIVEKVVQDPALMAQIPMLQEEIDILKARLKAEGAKCALLSQELAQKPREIIKKVSEIVEVEKIVEKEVRFNIPAKASRMVWAGFAISAALGFALGALL